MLGIQTEEKTKGDHSWCCNDAKEECWKKRRYEDVGQVCGTPENRAPTIWGCMRLLLWLHPGTHKSQGLVVHKMLSKSFLVFTLPLSQPLDSFRYSTVISFLGKGISRWWQAGRVDTNPVVLGAALVRRGEQKEKWTVALLLLANTAVRIC